MGKSRGVSAAQISARHSTWELFVKLHARRVPARLDLSCRKPRKQSIKSGGPDGLPRG